jgi:hypothetical protein
LMEECGAPLRRSAACTKSGLVSDSPKKLEPSQLNLTSGYCYPK